MTVKQNKTKQYYVFKNEKRGEERRRSHEGRGGEPFEDERVGVLSASHKDAAPALFCLHPVATKAFCKEKCWQIGV
jgi:hypothetical protein